MNTRHPNPTMLANGLEANRVQANGLQEAPASAGPKAEGPLAQLAAEFARIKRLFRRTPALPASIPARMKIDNRFESRYPVFGHGHCTIPGKLHQEPIQVLNVSLRGMHFRIEHPLQAGDQILVRIQLAGAPPYEEVMAVRWVGKLDTEDGSVYKVGAALIERVHVL